MKDSDTWDQILARLIVRPLVDTNFHPNYLTTLRLLVGLLGCAFLALGGSPWIHIGVGFFILSNFIDHTDGELARLANKTSKFGHRYDIVCDALVHVLFFICIGIGLSDSSIGLAALPLGIAAGFSVAGLFFLFQFLEHQTSEKQAGLPKFVRFDLEDIMYIVAPVIWAGGIFPLLFAAAIGAPIFGLWAFWRYRSVIKDTLADKHIKKG